MTPGNYDSWPVPPLTSETRFFWDGIAIGEFRIQRCEDCGRLHHPPRAACRDCQSLNLGYQRVSGVGVVYSFTVHYHPPVPGPPVPYISAIIDLDEGVRFVSNLVDVDPDAVQIGLPVQVVLREVTGGLTLPLFAPAQDESAETP